MSEIEHEFPLPETEKHKLDELGEEIQHEHRPRHEQHPLWFLICVLAVGCALGALFGHRRRS